MGSPEIGDLSLLKTGQGKQAALTATGNLPWDPFQRRAREGEGREEEEFMAVPICMPSAVPFGQCNLMGGACSNRYHDEKLSDLQGPLILIDAGPTVISISLGC